MEPLKLECTSCGALLKEVDGKAVCEYCGRQVILEVNIPQSVGSQVSWGQQNQAIQSQPPITPVKISGKPRSATTAFYLALFLGTFGVHRFYTGHTAIGFVYLFTMGLGGFGWGFDLLLFTINQYKDADGRPLKTGWLGLKTITILLAGTIILGSIVSENPDAPTLILLPAYGVPFVLVNLPYFWKLLARRQR